jgi:hypothetical protein
LPGRREVIIPCANLSADLQPTRQAVINDDLSAFNDVTGAWGNVPSLPTGSSQLTASIGRLLIPLGMEIKNAVRVLDHDLAVKERRAAGERSASLDDGRISGGPVVRALPLSIASMVLKPSCLMFMNPFAA